MSRGLSFSTCISGLSGFSERFASHATNLSAIGAIAGKEQETFLTSYYTKNGTVINPIVVRYLSSVGAPIETPVQTNFSIQGQGYVFVKDSNGNTGYTRNATFEPDEKFNFSNNQQQKLQVFLTDPNGVPLDPSLSKNSLETLNLENVVSNPKATTTLSVACTLPETSTTTFNQTTGLRDPSGSLNDVKLIWQPILDPTRFSSSSVKTAWNLKLEATQPDNLVIKAPYINGLLVEFDERGFLMGYNVNNTQVTTMPPLNVTFQTGANRIDKSINLDIGTIGQANGVFCSGENFERSNITHDGHEVGILERSEITDEGFVVAHFSNGQTSKYARIPLAIFPNVNNLTEVDAGFFKESAGSGPASAQFPGYEGVSKIRLSTYEGATINPENIYVKMIEDQKRYVGLVKTVGYIKDMLKDLRNV